MAKHGHLTFGHVEIVYRFPVALDRADRNIIV
jgi:hypothetical protein